MRKALIRKRRGKLITAVFGLLISIILFSAAFAKLSSPTGPLKDFFSGVGVFEVILAALLLVFHHRSWAWCPALLVFASWAGYALFWLLWGLPCNCFGKMLELPPAGSLAVDAVQYGIALYAVHLLGLNRKQIGFLLLFSLFLLIFGFLVGYGIHHIIFG